MSTNKVIEVAIKTLSAKKIPGFVGEFHQSFK